MSKHTPTPWRVAAPNDFPWMLEALSSNLEPTVTVIGAGGYGVISIPASVTGSLTQAIADMQHAVRCVNSHDALLSACKLLIESHRSHGPCENMSCGGCQYAYGFGVSAIASAEGGGQHE